MNWNWAWSGVFQWREWVTRNWNWRTFTVINLAMEAGIYKGDYVELEVVVLGVGFRLHVYHKPSRDTALEPILEMVRQIDKGEVKLRRLCPTCLQFGPDDERVDANVKELTVEEARQLELLWSASPQDRAE